MSADKNALVTFFTQSVSLPRMAVRYVGMVWASIFAKKYGTLVQYAFFGMVRVQYTLVQINLNTCKQESIFESFCFILKITKVQAVSEIINS